MGNLLHLKESLFIKELIKNENKASKEYLQNLFSKDDYRKLLENSLKLLKSNPNSFPLFYRSSLFKLSNLENKVIDLIDNKKLAPGIVVDYGTINNQETIVHGNRQEVVLSDFVLKESILPMDFYTIFDLASTSKLFTAISILQLAQHNFINLEKTVGDYTNKFPNLLDVKIIDLLTFNVPIKTDKRIDEAKTFDEAQNILFSIYKYESSTPYVYTDMGCLVLKYIIESVTKIPLIKYIETYILKPCEMYNTFLNVPEDYKQMVASENYASYVNKYGKIETINNIYLGNVHDPKANILNHNLGNASGHAGLLSNAVDMSKLAINLLNRNLLEEEYLLMLGKYNPSIDPKTDSKWKSHHGILTFIKQPNTDYLHVQPFLSGNAFISPGFAGTTFCLDPLNKIYAFSAANRLHNRIYKIPNEYKNNIFENTSGEKIYSDGNIQKVVSMTYTKDSSEIIKEAMMLALQIKMIEKIENDDKQIKLVREI